MSKKIVKLSWLPVVAGSLFFSFSTKKAADLEIEGFTTPHLELNYTVSVDALPLKASKAPAKALPKLGKSYTGFKEAIGFKESRGDYSSINEYGYMGKYQFGKGTLNLLGVYNTQEFLESPELQEATFYTNASRNKWILIRDIKRFSGKTINGVEVTESGILAAAHLAGPGSVKKYLRSYGAQMFNDAFGTSIKYYMKRFAGYDTSFIEPVKNPRVDFSKLSKI
ncbi:peptidoglycan-binding protein LysM [Zunongwangia endophytica]|uniref:Peptidoglycan-binding protein LysM n=1 Tax=Zunongwangia endophytica TaxID=1808945 RepID=A0ABV8HFA7_9FLAO|nr:peptidoglycan-binding protein LysM [Zunongwangia endophytica]MDN3596607.1 peptidoglycan-binding protein LysM [Zunongwangia endophytica]